MMRRLLFGLCVAVMLAGGLTHGAYAALDQITVANTAIGFTAAKINAGNGHVQANKAVCVVQTAAVVVRWDGGTPTSSVGTTLQVGTTLMLDKPDWIVAFLAIRSTSTSGQLDCVVME
jgi:hypothetical protein